MKPILHVVNDTEHRDTNLTFKPLSSVLEDESNIPSSKVLSQVECQSVLTKRQKNIARMTPLDLNHPNCVYVQKTLQEQ